MKRIFLFLLLSNCILYSPGQALKKYAVANTGCSIYMYCDPGTFEYTLSTDSSKVYSAECENDSTTYGIICIKLFVPIIELEAAEEVMISYLDYLKSEFEIATAVGVGKGHRLNNNEKTRGVIDYWMGLDGYEWKVKAWTDGKFISVLYAVRENNMSETKADLFFNGLRFPGM